MKQIAIFVAISIVFALLIPIAVFGLEKLYSKKEKTDINNESVGDEISVYFHNEGTVKNMGLEEYLVGVVAAEMPASFEKEALKAQAVAARSYTYYKRQHPSNDHIAASVCTDHTHCKAYKTNEELSEIWKDDYNKYSEKIKVAVYSTKGEIITYNGEAAMAVFHSQSAKGKTENAEDVWGGSVPYLVSVESHGETDAPNFYSSVNMSFEEFKNKLVEFNSAIIINSPDDIGQTELSQGGNVQSIVIGNQKISGKDIRSIFSLRSTCFEIKFQENSVVFDVYGYGHGVGMSQYGANTMAKEGASYKEILLHYYTGTTIES